MGPFCDYIKCHITFVSISWPSEYLLLTLEILHTCNWKHKEFEFALVMLHSPKSQFLGRLLNIILRSNLAKKVFYKYTIVTGREEGTRDVCQRGLRPESMQSGEGRGSSPGEMKICLVNSWYAYTICSIRLPLSLKHTEVIQSHTRSLGSLAKLFKEKF